MSNEADQNAPTVRTPPYVAYKTFLTLIDDLAEHGVPPIIDRSVLKRFSGGVGSQLLMTLKSLGLAFDDNKPHKNLAHLVQFKGQPEFKEVMRGALDYGYPFLKSLDLMTATPGMFADAFKVTGAKEDVLRKCRRFYLAAALDNGVQLGPRILGAGAGARAPRTANGGAASTAQKRPYNKGPKPTRSDPSNNNNRVSPDQTVQQQLLSKFPQFDPSWPDELKKSWFAGFKDLMAAAGTKTGDG